jgi:hypothetical protein
MQITCSGCNSKLNAKEDMSGKILPCPKCGEMLGIPNATAQQHPIEASVNYDQTPSTITRKEKNSDAILMVGRLSIWFTGLLTFCALLIDIIAIRSPAIVSGVIIGVYTVAAITSCCISMAISITFPWKTNADILGKILGGAAGLVCLIAVTANAVLFIQAISSQSRY